MDRQKAKHRQQERRRHHVRNKIVGTAERPRLVVNRSSRHIHVQLVDDSTGTTVAALAVIAAVVVGAALVDAGLAIVIAEHRHDRVGHLTDRVIGMRDGRIVFDGTPDQLTTGVARDIYGADDSFNESATSTALPADTAYAETMLG